MTVPGSSQAPEAAGHFLGRRTCCLGTLAGSTVCVPWLGQWWNGLGCLADSPCGPRPMEQVSRKVSVFLSGPELAFSRLQPHESLERTPSTQGPDADELCDLR